MAVTFENFESPAPERPANQPQGQGFGGFGGFGGAAAGPSGATGSIGESTADYDRGYRAGWEDAERRFTEESRRVSAALEQNLADLHFTLHEARAHVLALLSPLFQATIETLLPRLKATGLPEEVARELAAIGDAAVDGNVRLAVSPEDEAVLRALTADMELPGLTLVAEATLVGGQVLISTADRDRLIDLKTASEKIETALIRLTQARGAAGGMTLTSNTEYGT